jgi:hypothetical protein
MLSMITIGKDYEAHPAVWAPFVLVGVGAEVIPGLLALTAPDSASMRRRCSEV